MSNKEAEENLALRRNLAESPRKPCPRETLLSPYREGKPLRIQLRQRANLSLRKPRRSPNEAEGKPLIEETSPIVQPLLLGKPH
jgi:hypothetical protein